MAGKKRWIEGDIKDGCWTIELRSWKYFYEYIRSEMLSFPHYFWRGQADAAWKLESSLDRQLRHRSNENRVFIAEAHLRRFKYAARGRRGASPPQFDSDSDWWALGQHQGLLTPLLDWSESPFVALYFAFCEPLRRSGQKRAVWALGSFSSKNKELQKAAREMGDPDAARLLEIVRPLQDENSRLVSQSGLFTRAPLGTTVDDWISENFAGMTKSASLIKLVLPNADREDCLRTLNKMNINHLTLFPDLYGAAQHCNSKLQISRY